MTRGPRGRGALHFSFNDAKRLQHALRLEREDLVKKERWLLQSSSEKYRRPKLSTDVCMLEPYLKNEVSSKAIRSHVEKAFGPFPNDQRSYHFILDYLQIFDMNHGRIENLHDCNISEMLFSIIKLLNDEACSSVAFLVVNDNKMIKRTQEKIGIIKDYLPKFLEREKYNDGTSLKQLLHILQKPSSFLEKQPIIDIPVNPKFLSSISRILDLLHELSTQELNAMLRKLKDVKKVPQFPIVWRTCKRDCLVERVKKLCLKLCPQEGDDLPEPLAKALSVFSLSLKCKSIFVNQTKVLIDQPIFGYFHFPPKVVCMQCNIISALRSLSPFFQKNKTKELSILHSEKLKILRSLLDPEARCFAEKFKSDLKKYLVEWLFECDEVTITEEVTRAIDILNMSSEFQSVTFSEVTIEEESRAILNVSCELRKFVPGLLPDVTDDKCQDTSPVEFGCGAGNDRDTSLEEFESDESSDSDTFDLSATDYYSSRVCEYREILDSGSNYLEMASADSVQVSSTTADDTVISLTHINACGTVGSNISDDFNCKEPMNLSNVIMSSEHKRTAEDIAGETALVAYKLIGSILAKLMTAEGKDISMMAKCYLNGFGSSSADLLDSGVPFSTSNEEDVKGHLIQALDELVPSLSASCIQRAKNLMELPFSSETMP